jgi:hypothetical protein
MKDNALYLEADEDVTSAIDKLSKAAGSSVQIVVPKRSGMLQSIINLKLLKKAAENSGKELILVTNDRIATDLAARVGLPIAPSLGAKPVINEAEPPAAPKAGEDIIEADDPEPSHDAVAAAAAVSKPAKAAKKPLLKFRPLADKPAPAPAPMPAAAVATDAADSAADTPAKAAGPRVPNFAKLQRRALWLGLGVFLVAGYFAVMFFIQSATVTLYANGTKVDIDTTFTVDPAARTTDKDKAVLAGQAVSVSKDLSGTFTPTGKKDVGTKASGQITMYNEYDMTSHTIVAGTQLVAPDGKIFRTKDDATIPGATVSLSGGHISLSPGKSDPIAVEADQSGDTYNEGPAKYTVKNYAGDMQTKIYGQGNQMSGGTSKTVTVVTQNDVDTAKAAILDKDKDNATRDLKGKLPSGYVALEPTQTSTVDSATPSPAVDAEGTNGTLALKVTYSVLAVKDAEYHDLVKAQELKQIGANNQIYDDGVGSAQITTSDKDSNGRQTFHFTTEAYGGVKIDTAAVTAGVKGKRFGDALDLAKRQPGVSNAEIKLSPSWATGLPSRADKIKVIIQVAGAK